VSPVRPIKQLPEHEEPVQVAAPPSMDRRIEQRSLLTPRRITLGAGLLALIGGCVYAYLQFGTRSTLTIDDQRVTTSQVRRGPFTEYIPLSGNVAPRTTYYLDAVAGGQIIEVLVEPGAIVEKGQPLLRLENTDLQLQVISAEAQLTEQVSNLSSTQLSLEQNQMQHRRELIEIDYRIDQLKRTLARLQKVRATGGASESEIDDRKAELTYQQALRSAVAQAQTLDQRSQSEQVKRLTSALATMNENLAIARGKLSNLVIAAPIAGQLTTLEANVGESKGQGQRIGQIDELNAFRVTSFVDEFYLNRIAIGQRAGVELGDDEHTLEVKKIYPDVKNGQFQVDFEILGEPPDNLRRGQTVRIRLQIGESVEALLLANGGFISNTAGKWVFVVDEARTSASRREVRIGRRNPEMVEILEGLAEGDEVITSSYDNFTDFDQLKW
jgi:HlyD family secretion protein